MLYIVKYCLTLLAKLNNVSQIKNITMKKLQIIL